MHLFPDGLRITGAEHLCLLHCHVDPAQWLLDEILQYAVVCRGRLIKEWEEALSNHPTITELPADPDDLVRLIMSQDSAITWDRVLPGRVRAMSKGPYQTRLDRDAEQDRPPGEVFPYLQHTGRFMARTVPDLGAVIMHPGGLDIPDLAVQCIQGVVLDVNDWVYGALLGRINKGKKQLTT
jgi:hypothetical protein